MFSFFLGFVIMLAVTGYLVAFLQDVLRNSADGRNRVPSWPDFTGFGDLFSAFGQFFATLMLSLLPALAVSFFLPESVWSLAALIAALGFAVLYFPMAFMAVTMFDSLAALNPSLIGLSIVRIRGVYLLSVIVLAVVCAVAWTGQVFLPEILPIPILPRLVSEFLGLYLLVVEVRILGLLYLTQRQKLGWFRLHTSGRPAVDN